MKWFPDSGRFVGPHQVAVGDEVLTAEHVLVATGARPAFTPEQAAVGTISAAAALALPSLPRSVLVLGSEGRCLEAAQILARFGVQVAVVETGERRRRSRA
jgi:glutathione reductase (NADPH)